MASKRIAVSIEYGEGKPTTVAHLVEDGKVVKTAEARCHPADEYDAKTGIVLAVKRLFEKPEKVFSICAFVKDMIDYPDDIADAIRKGWVRECDGKTEKECKELGYCIRDSWLVDKE